MRGKTPMPFISISIFLWSKVLLKQTCQSVGLLINRHFEQARVLVTFNHGFKHFVQFSVNWTD